MKYMVLIADGMADYPVDFLGGKTPMEAAHTPNMDRLAPHSVVGLVKTIPDGYPPGSDVANMSVMGYDPARYYTGRSPLEAVSLGLELGPQDLALRCNLVCLSSAPDYMDRTMLDYSAGEIETEQAEELIWALQAELNDHEFSFHPGISYRHVLLWHGAGEQELHTTPPHDISDRNISAYLPQGSGGSALLRLMQRSCDLLQEHPVNQKRRERGLAPATAIWLWGQGNKPNFDSFYARRGLHASVVCAVDLVRGLGIAAGMRTVKVTGATGAVKTDFSAKAQAAMAELKAGQDLVFLHIESADEAGHQGDAALKVWSIEQIDRLALGPILQESAELKEFRLLLLPDHPTPIAIKTHSSDPVPFLYWDRNHPQTGPHCYCEATAVAGGIYYGSGPALIEDFIKIRN